MISKISLLAVLIAVCLAVVPGIPEKGNSTPGSDDAEPTYKILHIMSYHSPWRWTDGQFDGFKEALRDLHVEYKVFQMDTKRNSSVQWKEKKGREARQLIERWKPDLVYSSDDDAQQYVAKYYVNSDTPFVFSGVNKNPEAYGFAGSGNITGVMEQEHFVETVRLLQQIVPTIQKIAVVFDDASMWSPVMKRMKDKSIRLQGVELAAWDTIKTFAEYKHKLRDYQSTVDAIALIGIFNFKDEKGSNVPYQDVLRWTAENSKLPDFSYWVDRVHYGTLCAVNVSEYEQGLAAGRIAYSILAEGRSPQSFPMKPTLKGNPIVSLARANRLGLKVNSGVLLTAEVIQRFEWEK